MDTLIQFALNEDAAFNDLTAMAVIAADAAGEAHISARGDGILSGRSAAQAVFAAVDGSIHCRWRKNDADHIHSGDVICHLSGPLRSLLAAERTALNFLQHLSGIASATHAFVQAIGGTSCKIADTRKTTPGMRRLEKQAVAHGGGVNHRMDLQSGMLIKENHIEAAGSIADAVNACRSAAGAAWVEVECENMADVRQALAVCPDMILLDNMDPGLVRQARAIVPESILLEASGNITLENVRDYAATGVDRVAIGAITHSAPALDLSMSVQAGAAL
jgi:nicotinate-nucleotide pyrophosphorylase (carboxylating)